MTRKPIAAGKSSFNLIDPELVFAALALRKGETAIDLGCGDGRYCLAMAAQIQPGGKVVGIDLWPEGLAALELAAEDRGLTNVTTLRTDVTRTIPLPDHVADLVLMATVLHDFVAEGTADGALREARRLLKSKGRLAVLEFRKIGGPPGPPLNIRLDAKELNALVGPFEFSVVKSLEVGPFCYLNLFV